MGSIILTMPQPGLVAEFMRPNQLGLFGADSNNDRPEVLRPRTAAKHSLSRNASHPPAKKDLVNDLDVDNTAVEILAMHGVAILRVCYDGRSIRRREGPDRTAALECDVTCLGLRPVYFLQHL
jgi:hypothetical protein